MLFCKLSIYGRKTSQSISQASTQSAKQASRSVKLSLSQSNNQSVHPVTNVSVSQSIHQSVNQPVTKATCHPPTYPPTPPVYLSTTSPLHQSIHQTTYPLHQSVTLSINHLFIPSVCLSSTYPLQSVSLSVCHPFPHHPNIPLKTADPPHYYRQRWCRLPPAPWPSL